MKYCHQLVRCIVQQRPFHATGDGSELPCQGSSEVGSDFAAALSHQRAAIQQSAVYMRFDVSSQRHAIAHITPAPHVQHPVSTENSTYYFQHVCQVSNQLK